MLRNVIFSINSKTHRLEENDYIGARRYSTENIQYQSSSGQKNETTHCRKDQSRCTPCKSLVPTPENHCQQERTHRGEQQQELENRIVLLLISGYSGAGKDTLFNQLNSKYQIQRIAFADILKDEVYQLYAKKDQIFVREELDNNKSKIVTISSSSSPQQQEQQYQQQITTTLRHFQMFYNVNTHKYTHIQLVVNKYK